MNVETEVETALGWTFVVTINPESGPGGESGATRHDVRLSYVDYEFWSHGTFSPSRIVQVVVETLVANAGEWPGGQTALPAAFDAATGRRWLRDLDERVRESL